MYLEEKKKVRVAATERYLLLVNFQVGKLLPFISQVRFFVLSLNITFLPGKLYLASFFLGSWHVRGHISDMVGWCQCSGFSSPLLLSWPQTKAWCNAQMAWLVIFFETWKNSVLVLLASSRNFLEASRFSLLLQKCTVAVRIIADRKKFLVVPLGWRELIRNPHPFWRISLQIPIQLHSSSFCSAFGEYGTVCWIKTSLEHSWHTALDFELRTPCKGRECLLKRGAEQDCKIVVKFCDSSMLLWKIREFGRRQASVIKRQELCIEAAGSSNKKASCKRLIFLLYI